MNAEIKNTDIWKKLINHPQFNNSIQKCSKYCNVDDLIYEVDNNKLVVTYRSEIVNRDLDCQYKEFDKTEFYFDDEDNLVINESAGRIESKYGYSFNDNNGLVLKTHYSTRVFENDGVELSYSSYMDKYMLDSNKYDIDINNMELKILSSLNPKLSNYSNISGVYPHPEIIGKDGTFVRRIRENDNLGVVYNTRCYFDKEGNVNNLNEELYFNTMYGATSKNNPELIHIMNGFPFGTIDKNGNINIYYRYLSLGLTQDNYKVVSRDRLLTELKAEQLLIKENSEVLNKYNLMLEKIENKMKTKNMVH